MNQGTEDGGIPLSSKQTETSGLKLPARFRISGNLSTVLSIVWLFFSNSRSLQLIDTMIPEDWNIINAEISLASEISVNITAVQVSAYLNRLKSWTWFSAFNSWVYFTCLFVSLLRIRRFGACRADLLAPVLRVRLDTAGPGAAKGGKKFCITNICFEQKVFRLCCSWTRGRLSDALKAL